MPQHVIETKVFNRKDLRLRPHALHYEKTSHYQFSTDVLIHALAPHMHYRGKDFTLYNVEKSLVRRNERRDAGPENSLPTTSIGSGPTSS